MARARGAWRDSLASMTGVLLALPLLVAPARADLPPPDPAEVVAATCPADTEVYIAAVRERDDAAAVRCLVEQDEAGGALLAAAAAPGVGAERLSRALALHLMPRLDRALTGEEVRALQAADRRLLRDAVYARRGRATPAPDHEAVFAMQDWYAPQTNYTNGRLREIDRTNLATIDHPPEPPPPEPAAAAMAEAAIEVEAEPTEPPGTWCGCATGGGAAPWAWALVGLVGLRRRRG